MMDVQPEVKLINLKTSTVHNRVEKLRPKYNSNVGNSTKQMTKFFSFYKDHIFDRTNGN